MRNNIKIKLQQPKYIIDEKNGVVICHLKFFAESPDCVNFASKCAFHLKPTCTEQTSKAVVFVKNSDKFDVNVGKKVSLAKAENQAYSYVRNWAKTAQKELAIALDAIEDFEFKVERVKKHNIEYMRKF
jgi:hypothetical protein